MQENSDLEEECSVIGTLQLEVTNDDWDPLQYARLGRQTTVRPKAEVATPTPPAVPADKKLGPCHKSGHRWRRREPKNRHKKARRSQPIKSEEKNGIQVDKAIKSEELPDPATVVKLEVPEPEPQSTTEAMQTRSSRRRKLWGLKSEVDPVVKLEQAVVPEPRACRRWRGRWPGVLPSPTPEPPANKLCVLRPERTYERQRQSPKLVPPNCGNFVESCLERMDLGPMLEASEHHRHCLRFCFPAPHAFDFEAEQALVQLTLDAETAKEQAQQRTKYRRAYRYRLMHPTPDATQCEHCGSFYNTKPNFHLYSCSALHRKVPCPDCGRVFATSRTLRCHQVIHTRSVMKTHPCLLCGKLYASKKGVSRHMSDMHQDMMKHRHQCTICHRRFSEESGLLKHVKVHEGREPLCCPGCDKHFTYPSNMKYHKCRGRPS